MTKQEIRALVKARNQTADVTGAVAGALLAQVRLLAAWNNARRPCVYVSIPGEAPTGKILEACFAAGVVVRVPRVTREGLVLHPVTGLTTFVPGPFGILEPPANALTCPVGDTDCVIIPGMAFDGTGGRVGHGKGYYDRFLEKIPQVPRIALAWDWQLFPQVPTEAHDIRMDWIVTPTQMIKAG